MFKVKMGNVSTQTIYIGYKIKWLTPPLWEGRPLGPSLPQHGKRSLVSWKVQSILIGKCTFLEALYFVYLMMFSYSLSLPLLSLNLLYITLASTLAGLQRDKMKYDPNSISQWTSDKCSGANNNNVPSSDLPHMPHLKVLGSLRRLTTLRRMVRTFWVGFHLSQGSSPDWGSSTGGCRMEMQRSPFS